MKYLAYAKINIRLNVIGKNEQNYHNLSMVNAKITLADEIEIHESSDNVVQYSLDELNHLENDMCLNVLNELSEKFNIQKKYYIYIKKNIPLGAGLGGGSSDVACIINAIDELNNLNISLEEKIKIGLKYGADVPYCLINSLALVEGIGEKITLLNAKLNQRIALVYPNIFVSTKEVFKNVQKNSFSNKKEELEKLIINKEYNKLLYNDLEEASFKLEPRLKEIKTILNEISNTVMSGSGSSMLVFIENDEEFEMINKVFPDFLIVDTYTL